MVLPITTLKQQFATLDTPSGKDFANFIDTVIATAQAGLTTQIATAVAAALASQATSSSLIVQATPPNVSYAAFIWFKIDPSTGAVIRSYRLSPSDNLWHSRHPIQPGMIVAVTDASFNPTNVPTFDGGGTPGSGAMWSLATDLQGLTLLGANTIYPINTTGGAAATTIGVGNLPAHTHGISFLYKFQQTGFTSGQENPALFTNATFPTPTAAQTDSAGSASPTPINNLPPYKTAYFLRRTTRLDYVEAPGA